MPIRTVLNVTYSLLMENRDEKERKEIDAKLHGWDRENERAEQALWARGGEG